MNPDFRGPQVSPEMQAKMDTTLAQVDKACRPLGLYLDQAKFSALDDEGSQLVLTVLLTVGDLAWSNRVQNPIGAEMEGVARDLADDVATESAEELKRRFREGSLPWQRKEDQG